MSKLIANCRNDLAHLKRTVAYSLRGDPQCNETLTTAEMKEALRISLIVAAEEAFPREIKALRRGLDLFGPFNVVIGRRVEKHWILIATCFSTRANHLEVTYSLSSDSCLMVVRRFVVDRRHPATIYSDNGTNLVAAERELDEGMKNLNSKWAVDEMIDRGMNWKFSPPYDSHFGGIWERLVASCKRSLRAVLEERSVTDEFLLTVMKEVASLLNTRPITRVSTDPLEPEPLTPNHFILGRHHPHVPPNVETKYNGLSRRRWRQA